MGAPYGMTTVSEYVEGFGVITFCEVGNRQPAMLPWYMNPRKIPANMRREAEAVAAEMSSSTDEHNKLMMAWTAWMIGYSYDVKEYYPWFMFSPTQALDALSMLCIHAWGERREHTAYGNSMLGTYDRGYIHTCKKCGKEEYVTTEFNNYSGD